MKRKIKHTGGLFLFLEQSGVLANGTDEEIMAVKQKYWSLYKAKWRQKKRQACTEIRIMLKDSELKSIADLARKNKRSKTAYIKEAALAYFQERYLIPDIVAVNEIKQLLALNYTSIQKLHENCLVPYQTGTALLKQIAELENTVVAELTCPKTIEQAITDVVSANPKYKEILLLFLQNLKV